jgi:hypothetical protein
MSHPAASSRRSVARMSVPMAGNDRQRLRGRAISARRRSQSALATILVKAALAGVCHASMKLAMRGERLPRLAHSGQSARMKAQTVLSITRLSLDMPTLIIQCWVPRPAGATTSLQTYLSCHQMLRLVPMRRSPHHELPLDSRWLGSTPTLLRASHFCIALGGAFQTRKAARSTMGKRHPPKTISCS